MPQLCIVTESYQLSVEFRFLTGSQPASPLVTPLSCPLGCGASWVPFPLSWHSIYLFPRGHLFSEPLCVYAGTQCLRCRVKSVSPAKYMEVPIPSPSHVTSYGHRAIADVVEMRSYRVRQGLNPVNGVLRRKEEWRPRHTLRGEKATWRKRQRLEWCLPKPRKAKDDWLSAARSRPREILLHDHQHKHRPCTHCDCTPLASTLGESTILRCEATQSMGLCYGSPVKWTLLVCYSFVHLSIHSLFDSLIHFAIFHRSPGEVGSQGRFRPLSLMYDKW